jgi:hypothetical protein
MLSGEQIASIRYFVITGSRCTTAQSETGRCSEATGRRRRINLPHRQYLARRLDPLRCSAKDRNYPWLKTVSSSGAALRTAFMITEPVFTIDRIECS